MSDPVSNAEVEDVLSSIRRLVSEEKRSPAVPEAPSANDRLVLTPALRVAEDVRPQQDAPDQNFDQNFDQNDVVAAHVLDDEAQQPAFEAEAEAEVGETVQFQDVDEVDEPQSLDVADTGFEPEQSSDDDHTPDETDQVGDSDTVEPEALILPVETFENTFDEHDQIEDGSGDGDTPENGQITEASEDAPEATSSDEPADIPEAEPMDIISNAGTLSAKIAALETVIGRTDDQWEPDDTGDSDYSGTEAPAMSWEDTDADAVEDTEAAPAETDVFASPEDFLDEEALRDLVSDIVREELQGALGERITRNVRKLVRREIHRALAAQELE